MSVYKWEVLFWNTWYEKMLIGFRIQSYLPKRCQHYILGEAVWYAESSYTWNKNIWTIQILGNEKKWVLQQGEKNAICFHLLGFSLMVIVCFEEVII